MQLTLLPGRDVAVPVRFGGDASPQHGLVLRFGPMEYDGTVPGHLIAMVGQEHMAARRAVVWDPVLRSQVILIGGIGTILGGYLLYYAPWAFLAKTLLLWLVLPGLALAIACRYVHFQRMDRLSTALFQAAWHALDPEAYHAPR